MHTPHPRFAPCGIPEHTARFMSSSNYYVPIPRRLATHTHSRLSYPPRLGRYRFQHAAKATAPRIPRLPPLPNHLVKPPVIMSAQSATCPRRPGAFSTHAVRYPTPNAPRCAVLCAMQCCQAGTPHMLHIYSSSPRRPSQLRCAPADSRILCGPPAPPVDTWKPVRSFTAAGCLSLDTARAGRTASPRGRLRHRLHDPKLNAKPENRPAASHNACSMHSERGGGRTLPPAATRVPRSSRELKAHGSSMPALKLAATRRMETLAS